MANGRNSRLDALQAAVLRVKLRDLDRANAARRAVATRYSETLSDLPLLLPHERAGTQAVYHQFVIRIARRDEIRDLLAKRGVGTALHYPLPIPGQPLFRRLGYDAVACPAAWAASQQVLSLPCFPELRDDEVDAVIGAIRGYFEGEPP